MHPFHSWGVLCIRQQSLRHMPLILVHYAADMCIPISHAELST